MPTDGMIFIHIYSGFFGRQNSTAVNRELNQDNQKYKYIITKTKVKAMLVVSILLFILW
jgi:hypothetical protein